MRWILVFFLVLPVFGQFGPKYKIVKTGSGVPEIIPDFSGREYQIKDGMRGLGWPKFPEMKAIRVSNPQAVQASWEGEDLTWARNVTRRVNQAWSYFEGLQVDEVQARDYYVHLAQRAFAAGLPQEAARGAYLAWLHGVFQARLEALAKAEGVQVDWRDGSSIKAAFGAEADLAHLDWVSWGAQELVRLKDRLNIYSQTTQRREQIARNSASGYEISGTNKAVAEIFSKF